VAFDDAEKALVPSDVRCFAGETFTVWRCAHCRSIHAADEVDLGRYYARYPLKRHVLDFATRMLYRNRLRYLGKFGLSPGHRVLDYGCGTGVFVQYLSERGFVLPAGYDRFVEQYADTGVLHARYDAVVSFDVIEHVEDPKSFLTELRNLAEPGGLVVIGTPNADNLSLSEQRPAVELSQPYHRHILSEKALVDSGRALGLNVLEVLHKNPVDSVIPGMNLQFMWSYIRQTGGWIDASIEPIRLGKVLSSPSLLLYAFFGKFMPPRGNMVVVFRKP
jgi:SAM-dependent methyltransferase